MSDASLVPDESFVATSHRGLTYPFGGNTPALGELTAIASGVAWHRIPMPGGLDHINVWVLDDGAGFALVDTGLGIDQCRKSWEAVFAGPLAGRKATRVIGTHFHPDHIGLAGWLCRRFGVGLAMTRGEWLTARVTLADARDAVPDEVGAFRRAGGWSDEQIANAAKDGWSRFRTIVSEMPLDYLRLHEGDRIAVGARQWRVVVGSGHSPEHACLWDEESGLLIAGDQVLPRISSNVSLSYVEPQADPLGEWLDSIAKLKTLPADLLVLPSHGEPFTGLHTRLDALDREHRMRLDMLHEFLSEPRRATDCFGRMFRRAIGERDLGLATGETLAHLRRLEVEGRATREIRDGVWWYSAA